MIHRKKPDVDIVSNLLHAVLEAKPDSTFVSSLLRQYQERGGLSKKQLEGLYKKAEKIEDIPAHWLATLEAVILKKPTRYRSTPPPPTPLYSKDENTGTMIAAILERYPQHKRVLFFRSKYENNEPLAATELTELEKFHRLLASKT